MSTTHAIAIEFSSKKAERSADRTVVQFANFRKALSFPENRKDYIEKATRMGFATVYRGSNGKEYLPTETGWRNFLAFIDFVHQAEPFKSKATKREVHLAYAKAFANMISAGKLPENHRELAEYLSTDFIESVCGRHESRFHKMLGIKINDEGFFRIGGTWLGKYGSLCFDHLSAGSLRHKNIAMEGLKGDFGETTTVISGGRIQATSERARLEDTYRCDVGIGLLCILLNRTYKDIFSKLFSIRRVEKPEQDLGKQFSFGLINRFGSDETEISFGVKGADQEFELNSDMVAEWQNFYELSRFNRILSIPPSSRKELEGKLINSIIYFRQATLQPSLEMQFSTLWICVESLLTTGDKILENIQPNLQAITAWSLPPGMWPGKAMTFGEMSSVFSNYYKLRCRTFHHGKTGHVRKTDVQNFSVLVSNLIIAIANLSESYSSTDSLLRQSKELLAQAEERT